VLCLHLLTDIEQAQAIDKEQSQQIILGVTDND
jgi:hypothetical protein